MKAITAVCATGASVPVIINGRVSRQQRISPTNNVENAEIKMYLSKLKNLVPFMPKNRKLSKLEIIQHVIDYICELQSELETSPSVSNFDAAAVLHELQQHDDRIISSPNNSNSNKPLISSISQNYRQPLVDRSSPNLILSSSSAHSLGDAIPNHQISFYHHSSGQHNLNHQSSSHKATEKINPGGNSQD